ncbi:glycosyltransferase family 2 protein [Sphingobacterium sp. MYb388]|uniref:glycosyltransferase family 2 protein n=1 Tax=Sphingobacterium sp. MYb388 TaxID=2745437 RepID=UPI00309EBA2A
MEITILMPCLNEEETIEQCIIKALKVIENEHLDAEVLVADNGSTDQSLEICRSLGVRVVHVLEKGYGAALLLGIKEAKGRYVIMADSDDSYNFSEFMPFVKELRKGYDLVIGNRFKGGISPGAMPVLHRYLGNPVLSSLGRIIYHVNVRDFHCGYRGVNRSSIIDLKLNRKGMDFASEMVVKSALQNLKITEIPVRLYPDGRSRAPHLKTWSDGWRHLRFLLLSSPSWLFLYPGGLLMSFGFMSAIIATIYGSDVYALFSPSHISFTSYGSLLIGFQLIAFYFFANEFGASRSNNISNKWISNFNKVFRLEKGLLIGGGMILVAGLFAFQRFDQILPYKNDSIHDFPFAALIILFGVEVIFNCFLFYLCKNNRYVSS